MLLHTEDSGDKRLVLGAITLCRLLCEVVDEEEALASYGVFIVDVVSEIFPR